MFYQWCDEEQDGLSGSVLGGVVGVATQFLGGLFGQGAKNRAAQYQQGSEIIKQQEKEIASLDVDARIAKSSIFYQFGKKYHKFNKQNPLVMPIVMAAGIYYLASR